MQQKAIGLDAIITKRCKCLLLGTGQCLQWRFGFGFGCQSIHNDRLLIQNPLFDQGFNSRFGDTRHTQKLGFLNARLLLHQLQKRFSLFGIAFNLCEERLQCAFRFVGRCQGQLLLLFGLKLCVNFFPNMNQVVIEQLLSKFIWAF